ncbi:hypothetical protein N0V88_001453 [Collariella sp. IMI 366227]|nr:hypothetical protein N0V88_001453 [Collariella sp. IMI 366227]
MPSPAAPRSVSDATRFTATTPHASSKTATPPPRFSAPRSAPSPAASAGPSGAPGGGRPGGPSPLAETPEQKVARLRAAHQRAKAAKISKFDKLVDASRRVLDSAHKATVAGLVGFTVIAGLVTAYTAVDMIMYNKKRGGEWVEAQKKLEADSLEAARLAYMTNKATPEQAALVEEQLAREREAGAASKTSFFNKMPSVLGAPEAAGTSATTAQTKPSVTETVSWPSSKESTSTPTEPQPSTGGLWSWLTSNLKREEEGGSPTTGPSSSPRLGWESLSEEDDGAGVRDSDLVRAVEEKQAYVKAKAAEAPTDDMTKVEVVSDIRGHKGDTIN